MTVGTPNPTPLARAEAVLDQVLAAVRDVGDDLLRGFATARPPRGLAEALAAFEALNGPASERLRLALTGLIDGSAWADSELEAEDLDATVATADSPWTWVCDAVDGAVQYLQAIPAWCVSVALLHECRTVLAVIHDPVHGETFHAVAGAGAFRNGERVHAAAKTDLGTALLVHANQPQPGDPETAVLAGRSFAAVYPRAMAVRNLGPTALQLAYLAAGRVDGLWQYGADPYNWVGGILIAEQAGAVATECDGAPRTLGSPSLAVAAPGLHSALVGILVPVRAAG